MIVGIRQIIITGTAVCSGLIWTVFGFCFLVGGGVVGVGGVGGREGWSGGAKKLSSKLGLIFIYFIREKNLILCCSLYGTRP